MCDHDSADPGLPQSPVSGARKTLLTGSDGRLSLILCEPSDDGSSTGWTAMTTGGHRNLTFAGGVVIHDGKADPHRQTLERAMTAIEDAWSERRPFKRQLAGKMLAASTLAGRNDPDFARLLAACGWATLPTLARGCKTKDLAFLDWLAGARRTDAFFAEWPFLLGLLSTTRFPIASEIRAGGATVAAPMRGRFLADDEDENGDDGDDGDDAFEPKIARIAAMEPNFTSIAAIVSAGSEAAAVGSALAAWAGPGTEHRALTLLLKRMRGKASAAGADILPALELVSAVPADWIPDDGAEFAALAETAGRLRHLVSGSSGALSYGALAASAKGRWQDFLDRLAAICPCTEEGDVADMVSAFRIQVAVPGLLHALAYERPDASVDVSLRTMLGNAYADLIATDAAKRPAASVDAALDRLCWTLLFSGKSAPAIMEASQKWHAAVGTMNDNIGTLFRIDWDVPFDRVEISEDVALVAIQNSLALSREGAELRHCVGGGHYVERARCRDGVIAAIRRTAADGTVRSTSTVEMTGWTPGKVWRPQVVQHRGACNAVPSDADKNDLFHAMQDLTGMVAKPVAFVSPPVAERRPWCALVSDLLRDAKMRAAWDPALGRNHPPRGADVVVRRIPDDYRAVADQVTVGAQYDWLLPPSVAVALAQWSRFVPRGTIASARGLLAATEQAASPVVDALRTMVRDATADYRPPSPLDLARVLPSVAAGRFRCSRVHDIFRRAFASVTPLRAAAAIAFPFLVYGAVLLAAPFWNRAAAAPDAVAARDVPVIVVSRGGMPVPTVGDTGDSLVSAPFAPLTPPERRVVSLAPEEIRPTSTWEVVAERYGLPVGQAAAVFADGHAGRIDLMTQTVMADGTTSSAWPHAFSAFAVIVCLALATVAAEAVRIMTGGVWFLLGRDGWIYPVPEWPRNIAFAGAVFASLFVLSAPSRGMEPGATSLALLLALGASGGAFATRSFVCLLFVAVTTLLDALIRGIAAPFPSVAHLYGPLGAHGWDIVGLFGISALSMLVLATIRRTERFVVRQAGGRADDEE